MHVIGYSEVVQAVYDEVFDVTCCVRHELLVRAEALSFLAPAVHDGWVGLVAVPACVRHR